MKPSLFRSVPRKALAGGGNPQLIELQKKIGAMLSTPVDYSQEIAEIGKKKVEFAKKAPTAYSLEALKTQGALAQARQQGQFYQQNQVPQMQATSSLPLPTRQEVALPDRADNRNESAARFGASIAGLFNPNVDNSQVIAGGQRKDELAYQQARDNYSLALQKADQKYRDEAFAREQAMNAEAQKNEIDYKNAMLRYGQAEQANTAQANIAGLEGQGQGLADLDAQTREFNAGMEQYAVDLAALEAKSKTNREAWEVFGRVSEYIQKAEELAIQGDLANSKILADQAMIEVHKEQVKSEQQVRDQNAKLFPGKQREQGLRNQSLISGLETDKVQRRVLQSQAAENYARVGAINRQGQIEKEVAKGANLNAVKANIEAQVAPYEVQFKEASKVLEQRAQEYKELRKEAAKLEAVNSNDAGVVQMKLLVRDAEAALVTERQRVNDFRAQLDSATAWKREQLDNVLRKSPLAREDKVTGRRTTPKPPPKGLTGKPIQILGVR